VTAMTNSMNTVPVQRIHESVVFSECTDRM